MSAKPPAGCGAHGTNSRVRGADRHIDNADLVFDLTHHDSGFARVVGHPVQHAGGRAHWVGAVELYACGRASHRHGCVASQHGVAGLGHGQRPGEGL